MLVYHFEGVPRNPITVALKNILTLGIHTKVWLYRINREMDGHAGFHVNLRLLGFLVALPIVTPIIVKFQTVRRLNRMVAHQVTVPVLRSRYLGWISLVPVVGQALYTWWVQGTLNKHWFWHRREERIRLGRAKIKQIASDAETEQNLKRRFECEEQVRTLEQEIAAELAAAEIRLGPERWAARTAYAERMAAKGTLSRKERELLRSREKALRRKEKADRKVRRRTKVGTAPLKADGAPRDIDIDADWESSIALPARSPEDIDAAAAAEGRELSDDERGERKAAEKALAAHEKDTNQLAKTRERLLRAREKAAARAEKEAEKAQRLAETKKDQAEKAAAKPQKAKKAKPSKPDKKSRPRKAPKASGEAKIPVKARKVQAAPVVHEAGDGPLRTLNITCPRCGTEIVGIKKRGDAPAKMKCPSCALVGRV